MIPNFIVVDGVNTTLADAVSTTSTTITLASSANLPTLGSGQMMPLILQSASNASANEVVYVTAISGASLTVERGQEGTSAQSFAVGDLAFCGPTAGTVPLLGIQTLQPTASVSITPSYMTTIVQPNITAAATITIEPGTVVGQRVRVYGGAYAVTDQPNVTTGSPYFGLPDGSTVYSWVIPAGATDDYIDHVWDGTNWRCITAGQTVVAAATQPNAAPQFSQVGSYNGVIAPFATGTLPSNCWGQAVQVGSGDTVTLPTSTPVEGSKVVLYGSSGGFTVVSNSNQFIYSPTTGLTSTTGPTTVNVTDGGWIEITARGTAEYDITGGSLLVFQNTTPNFTNEVTVPAATQNNAAVQLAQVLAVTTQYNQHDLTPASGDTYTISNTFTAPCNGFILAASTINVSSTQPATCTNTVSINGTSYGTDDIPGSMTNWGAAAVSSGTACTVTSTYQIGTSTTAAFVPVSQTVMSIFIPNP